MKNMKKNTKTKNDRPEKRLETETDIRKRSDRVGQYLKCYLNDFVFDEFSDAFLEKAGVKELMVGVPVPLRKADVGQFEGGQGLKTSEVAENMVWIIGIDPKFMYAEHYIAFLLKLYNTKIYEVFLQAGTEAADKENFDKACVYFRACLCVNPNILYGMYSYARVCREMYLKGGNEDYVGNFKAESIDYFELITEQYPDFVDAYYYLGYAYLNLGLYTKAEIIWRQFIEKTENAKAEKNQQINEIRNKEIREIHERLHQLQGPVKIESGCNDVMAGRYEEGIFKLEPYLNSPFKTWWPLFYYVGIAYSRVGDSEQAVDCFKTVLTLNPSNIDTMEELVAIYSAEGDKENEQKYSRKIELIKTQFTQE